jgi:hypothetical protein
MNTTQPKLNPGPEMKFSQDQASLPLHDTKFRLLSLILNLRHDETNSKIW